MKKIILLIFTLMTFTAFGSVEMSVTKDYAKKFSTGERIKTNQVDITLVRDIDLFDNTQYTVEIGYRIKKSNSKGAYIPKIGVRYYPVSILPIFVNSAIGVELETRGGNLYPMAQFGVGYRIDDIITSTFVSASANKKVSTGFKMGYKL